MKQTRFFYGPPSGAFDRPTTRIPAAACSPRRLVHRTKSANAPIVPSQKQPIPPITRQDGGKQTILHPAAGIGAAHRRLGIGVTRGRLRAKCSPRLDRSKSAFPP